MGSSPLRVLQVVNVRWFNATAWYGLKLAHLLREAGHVSKVLALPHTESFEKAQDMGLEPVPLDLNPKNPLAFPALWRQMWRIIKEFRPDVVNCHRGESFVFWGLFKAPGGYALVRTRGDQRLPRGNWPNRWLHRHAADAVIATNSRMSRHFATTMGLGPDRLHTILGGVDGGLFHFDAEGRRRMRAAWGLKDKNFAIGLLGRFDHVKGQRESLEALRLLGDAGARAKLILIGFPTAVSQEEVEGWIRERGLEDRVILTGKVDDVPACLSALDLGIITSLGSETIARAALEIMACGRPLLSTPVGVMPDLLPREALVAPDDWPNDWQKAGALLPSSLAALLRRAVEDRAWLEGLAAANARRMESLRDADFLAATLDVYERALQRRRG